MDEEAKLLLKRALARIGRTRRDQAKALRCTTAAIGHWLSGRSSISPRHAAIIEMLSGGLIAAERLCSSARFERMHGRIFIQVSVDEE